MTLVAVWLALALLAGIVEMIVPALVCLFVALAALLAAALSGVGAPAAIQVVVFAAASVLLLAVVRPILAMKRLGGAGVPSRTEALAGKLAHVTEAIDPVRGTGRVNVAGEDWAARCAAPVPAGAEVRVDGADGIVLIVSTKGK